MTCKARIGLGELHFMGEAITSAAGLFGAMQLGLKHHANQHQVRITLCLRDHLSDFKMLAESLSDRPS
jgi:MOSC domain-containing protein YiiM